MYTVNYPLQYFAQRIAGELVDVRFPAPSDEDPAYWKPDAKTIEGYQKADLILLNGATYAKWVQMTSLPTSKLVDTSSSFRDQFIRLEEAMTHAHGPEGKHAHGGIAFTTWIDFAQAAKQARAIKAAFEGLMPEKKTVLEGNFAELERDLLDLDEQMQVIAKKTVDKPLIASHPVYQYWTRRYGLNVRSVHWEPDETPDEEQWREFEEIHKTHPAKWMIWEGDPIQQTVDRLKSLGVGSMVFSPCGNAHDKGDFLSLMRQNIDSLRSSLI
ncbi:MAG: metal ABC transporter substrate-binding protein [Planctomycetota bacterium]